ncbi:MASE4 domain-containing protein [Escherichia coli]|uniref:MASE4 domain-containing protein n=1 Tax=Escherichia coli TaxID=562 RepID=UPI003D9C7168
MGLVFSLFYTRAVNNDIWKGILLIAVSAVFYNIFVLFIVDGHMHLWYLSRMAEMFSKLIVVSVFIYHIFKVLKSTKQLSNLDPMTKRYEINHLTHLISIMLLIMPYIKRNHPGVIKLSFQRWHKSYITGIQQNVSNRTYNFSFFIFRFTF